MRKNRLMMTAGAFLLFAAGCGGSNESAQSADICAGDGVQVKDAWVRAAHEGSPMSAAYMQLCNGAAAADALVSAAMEGVEAVEIHIMEMTEDGVMSMSPTSQIDLPVRELTALEPGGAHIMLIGLSAPIAVGDQPVLSLQFANAPSQEVTLDVRDGFSGEDSNNAHKHDGEDDHSDHHEHHEGHEGHDHETHKHEGHTHHEHHEDDEGHEHHQHHGDADHDESDKSGSEE